MKKVKRILLILIMICLLVVLGFLCFGYVKKATDKEENPIVSMEIEGYGTIEIELYPDIAPNTVKNFIALSKKGFYNGKTFSQIGDSYIEGGYDLVGITEEKDTEETENAESTENSETEEDKKIYGPRLSDIKDLKDGEENKTYSIEGEFVDAGYGENRLNHERGIVSMARKSSSDYTEEIAMMKMMGESYSAYTETILSKMNDSATSGFFIMTDNDTKFNGNYAAFGRVVKGMDILDKISELETEENEDGEKVPKTQPVIKNVSVDTKGVNYSIPETVDVFDFDSIFSMFLSNSLNS